VAKFVCLVWGICVGELTGALPSPLAEELVKLPAGGIKGVLLLLGRNAREEWATFFIDGVNENLLDAVRGSLL
jgi:hypothetical protein